MISKKNIYSSIGMVIVGAVLLVILEPSFTWRTAAVIFCSGLVTTGVMNIIRELA